MSDDFALRDTSVTRFELLPRTGDECHACDEGEFRRDGHERICDECHYVVGPEPSRSPITLDPWERHRRQVSDRADDDEERPSLVGGYRDAYWGSSEYEYDPSERGFSF
jgi:hypothetical protein